MSIVAQIGRYRHYKGKEYTVIGVARHSEAEVELVIYRKEYDDYGLWVRPLGMFRGDGGGQWEDGSSLPVPRAKMKRRRPGDDPMLLSSLTRLLRILTANGADVSSPFHSDNSCPTVRTAVTPYMPGGKVAGFSSSHQEAVSFGVN